MWLTMVCICLCLHTHTYTRNLIHDLRNVIQSFHCPLTLIYDDIQLVISIDLILLLDCSVYCGAVSIPFFFKHSVVTVTVALRSPATVIEDDSIRSFLRPYRRRPWTLSDLRIWNSKPIKFDSSFGRHLTKSLLFSLKAIMTY